MTWIDLIWPMAIAACMTLSLIHFQISLRLSGRVRRAHFFFALSALAVAVAGCFELALLRVETAGRYNYLMYWAQFPLVLMLVSLAGFIWFYFGKGRRWLMVCVVILSLVTLAVNLAVPQDLRIRHAESIRVAETLGGALFTLPKLRSGPVSSLELVANMLLIVLVVDSSVRAWRDGRRRQAAILGGSIVFFLLVSRQYAALVEAGWVETPYFFIIPFLALLVAMGRELSLDVFLAVRLGEQLKESERQVDLAARAATLGFWRWDMRSGELWATESARILFAVGAHEPLTFDRFMARVHPEDRELVRRAIEESIAQGQDYEVEYRIHPEGTIAERWIGARGRVDSSDANQPAIMRGVVIDITDRKQAQAEVENMRKELAHVSRVSIMGELAGSLAHELNQPLAAILSNAQAARRMLASNAVELGDIREIVEDIIRDDKRAGDVIHRLRTLIQKREHGGSEAFDLGDIVRDVARLLHSEFVTRHVDLVLRVPAHMPDALAGRVEIQQVLLNLMVNGMDAMRDRPRDGRRMVVEAGSAGGHISVSISDSGTGIPDSIMPDIFRPFFTTKEHGLGMGLAISRSIVEAYGGTLTARNLPEGGACFALVLPVAGGRS